MSEALLIILIAFALGTVKTSIDIKRWQRKAYTQAKTEVTTPLLSNPISRTDEVSTLSGYPIPPEGTTSYSTYSGRVVLLEPFSKQWGKSKGLISREISIMMVVNNHQHLGFELEPHSQRNHNEKEIGRLFSVTGKTETIKKRLLGSYLVSPKLIKTQLHSPWFKIYLEDGRLYYTQRNAHQKDIDRALDLLTQIADELEI